MTRILDGDRRKAVAALSLAAAMAAASLLWPSSRPTYGTAKGSYRAGLVNASNYCFANSVIQMLCTCLAVSRLCRETLAAEERRNSAIASNSAAIAAHAGEVRQAIVSRAFIQLQSLLPVSRQPLHNSELISALEVRFGAMLSREQQDAQEFAQLLLESLLQEHMSFSRSSYSPAIACMPSSRHSDATASLVGILQNSILCPACGTVRCSSAQKFLILSLSLPQKWSASLEECIASYFQDEAVQAYKCVNCTLCAAANSTPSLFMQKCHKYGLLERSKGSESDGNHKSRILKATMASELADEEVMNVLKSITARISSDNQEQPRDLELIESLPPFYRDVVRRTTIKQLPSSLIIHINRSIFDGLGDARRNNCSLLYGPKLKMETSAGEVCRYRLVAFITHAGSHRCGHYKCIENFGKQRWLEFDDASTRRISHDAALSMNSSVYMLHYELESNYMMRQSRPGYPE